MIPLSAVPAKAGAQMKYLDGERPNQTLLLARRSATAVYDLGSGLRLDEWR
jgi:hypothetical protein